MEDQEQKQKINLNFTLLTGGNFSLSVESDITVDGLKKIVSKKLKISKDRICLMNSERWFFFLISFLLQVWVFLGVTFPRWRDVVAFSYLITDRMTHVRCEYINFIIFKRMDGEFFVLYCVRLPDVESFAI